MLFSYVKKENLEYFQSNDVIDIDKGFNDYDKLYKKFMEEKEKINKKINNDYYPDITSDPKNEYLMDYKGDGIYYNFPYKFNSRKINYYQDIGILKNNRNKIFSNSYTEEIKFDNLNKILKYIEISKYLRIDKNIKDKNIYKTISELIINEINKLFVKFKLGNTKHLYDKRKYELFSYTLVNDKNIDGISNKNIILNIAFYKHLKEEYYTIQLNANYNGFNNTIRINQIDILGINEEENITFSDLKKPKQKYCLLNDNNLKENKFFSKYSNKFNTTKLEKCHNDKLVNNKLTLDLYKKEFNENEVKDFLKYKETMKKNGEENKKYKCFLKDGFNESTCKAYSLSKKTSGVYDKPCNYNEECPFYKKNKNYENSRGGCIKGYCEMPLNIKRVGYKVYLSKHKPFCHNCNKKNCLGDDCFTCCDEQKDKNKYPNLKSPDYMFTNDSR